VRTHHDLDPRRFIPTGPETDGAYGAWLGSQLDRRDTFVLVAEQDGQVVGYVYGGLEGTDYMALRGPAGAVYDIVVDPAHRRGGMGRALLHAALAELRARGAPQVVLSTAEGNVAAQRLFRSAGFRPTMREMTLTLAADD